MIRIIDLIFSLLGLILLSPLLIIIFIIGYFDTGYPLFRQERMGKLKKPFNLVKFRSMVVTAESVATHMANSKNITSFGHFLRKKQNLMN